MLSAIVSANRASYVQAVTPYSHLQVSTYLRDQSYVNQSGSYQMRQWMRKLTGKLGNKRGA